MNKEIITKELRDIFCKVLEIDNLNLSDTDNLLTSNLDIDSIDALEIELNIKKKYQIKMERLPKEIFTSIDTIADFIISYQE